MSTINAYEELIKALSVHKKSIDDIKWVGVFHRENECKNFCNLCSIKESHLVNTDDFLNEMKKFNYHNGYGGQEFPSCIYIFGDGWHLERGQYDGSEWWELRVNLDKPSVIKKMESLELMDF